MNNISLLELVFLHKDVTKQLCDYTAKSVQLVPTSRAIQFERWVTSSTNRRLDTVRDVIKLWPMAHLRWTNCLDTMIEVRYGVRHSHRRRQRQYNEWLQLCASGWRTWTEVHAEDGFWRSEPTLHFDFAKSPSVALVLVLAQRWVLLKASNVGCLILQSAYK